MPLKARSVAKAEREGARVPSNIANRRTPDNWLNDPLEPASADPQADAERLIRSFLPRAFRGPVPEELAKFYVARVQQKLDEKYSFYDAMLYGYQGDPLVAPLSESFQPKPGPASSTIIAIANRLSYFLWSGPPDDDCSPLPRAESSRSRTICGLRSNACSTDPRAHRFTENFTGQWLDLRQINATIPDPRLYGDFDGLLALGDAARDRTWSSRRS